MAGLIDDNQKHVLEEALRQFVNSQLQGQEPDIDELVKRYPEYEHEVRERIRKLQKINNLFSSLVQPDESDFEDTAAGRELVGQKVGTFEIVEIIGRGGMGVVYLALDTRLDRSVAIKSMPAELQASSTAQARFQREAKLLASLNHPNIAVIHEIIEQEEGASYLVLEYVPGQTLAQRIAHKPLKLEEALSIGRQVADAISAAHKKGIVHRDLKPGNIKITPDGRVKVLDFGLAKASASEAITEETTVTQPGRVIGTPAYMSPEQARGKPTDHRTDIWSFGCIMYQMLTGKLPFEGETATDTLARIIEREPDWELLPQETPADIRALIQRCLEKELNRRLVDVGDAVIGISETLSKPVTVSPMTIGAKLRRTAVIIGAVAIGIILSGIALKYIPQKEIQPSLKQIRLVVLPFENLGPAADSYFAIGLTDEVTTRLAGVHGLRVYKNRDGVATQFIKELGIDYILEGTIQRARPSDPNSPVRIRPQLFRASDDSLVWAKPYDDDMREVLQIQSDLAEEIAQVLDITLLGPERRALASRPTENLEAYEYYLRGNEYYHRSLLENDFKIAIRMYEKAVELDPTFAVAYAKLSSAHVDMYWEYYDHSDKRLEKAKDAIEKAVQLNPELPEVCLALGHYYYHGHLDYDRALERFAISRKSQPNNSELLLSIGWVQRRQGKFKKAVVTLKEASELDPLSNKLVVQVGVTLMLLREYAEAERYYDRTIELAPDKPTSYYFKARLYLCWQGSTEKARAVLEEVLQFIKPSEEPGTGIANLLVDIDVYDGNYQGALDRLSLEPEDIDYTTYFIPKALRYARIYRYMGNNQKAKEYYEQAIDILKSKIAEDPNDARFHSSLGIAYAGLGRKEDALREGKLGEKLLPVTKDAWASIYRVEDLARIYTMVGEYNLAIEQVEYLLSIPGEMSIPLLRLDPVWEPLRDHPRFKKLIEAGK